MSNKYYLLHITFLLFVCFARSQSLTEDTTDYTTVVEPTNSNPSIDQSTAGEASTSEPNSNDITTVQSTTGEASTSEPNSNDITTVESISSSLSTLLTPFSSFDSTTNLVATTTDKIENSIVASASTIDSSTAHSFTINPNITDAPTTADLSSISSMMSHTSITSTSIPFIGINLNETYSYEVESPSPLETRIVNRTDVKESVQSMVHASFNLTDFNITVTKIEIASRTKNAKQNNGIYDMLVDIWFRSNRNNCNLACIDNAATSTPLIEILLPGLNNTSVRFNYTFKRPVRIPNPTINVPKGGPSPGVPAQLGMGLGISFFGVILIAETILLYRITS
ncbi:unnamed protein product [Rotaria sp. Silwood1]|nr:unnamed protein product [Rotaria sp. Silwood1]CAF1559930.1 unnamed protein product [Rotaria sp. Silwood1]CAF3686911.1 unnamed protein product [Rotaria sp. Silwood1]CAF4877673.1 unnamed protein product [Rotaria sp. Silwood1]